MRVRSFPLATFEGGIKSNALSNGLRPREELSQNPAYLSQATNVLLSEDGCFDAETFTRSFALDEAAQIFSLHKGLFVLTQDTIYQYDNSELTQLLTTLTVGTRWSEADFQDYVLFTNGEINLIRNPTTGIFAIDDGTIFPLANCMCAHRGRVILGGPINYPTSTRLYDNWVAWSDINNLKFVSNTELDQARQNLSGYMPMPWEGNILRVMPLGDKVIVYGDNGITALFLTSASGISSTYGQRHIHDVGIMTNDSIVTNGKIEGGSIHYFVDDDGWLYELKENLELNRLGYKEFLI